MDAIGRAVATPRPQSPNTRKAYLDDDTEGRLQLADCFGLLFDALLRLYLSGWDLINQPMVVFDGWRPVTRSVAVGDAIRPALESLFGEMDQYVSVPVGPDGLPLAPGDDEVLTVGSLADDLSDVYSDIAGGLVQLREAVPTEDVVREWRGSLTSHWGRHSIDALRTLHALVV